MDHNQAIKEMAAERYLLNELTPELRDAFEEHARHRRQFLNTQRLGVIHPEPFNRLGGTVALLTEGCNSTKMLSLRAAQQAIDDFALDQVAENWNVLRRIDEADEPGTCTRITVSRFARTDSGCQLQKHFTRLPSAEST